MPELYHYLQQLINGLTVGSTYALIAIGYTMVFGIIGMVIFAHGDVFMVSDFIALITFLVLTTWLGIGSIVVALLAALARVAAEAAGAVALAGRVPCTTVTLPPSTSLQPRSLA